MDIKKAFTITELLVVVIIVGLIAAFAIPNYKKAVERNYERKGVLILNTMAGLNETWKAQHGDYPIDTVCWETEDLNEKFKQNIVEDGFNLYCCPTQHDSLGYECGIQFDGTSVGLHIHEGVKAHCLGGYSCPTLTTAHLPN